MKRVLITLAIIVVVAGGILGCLYYYNANRDFTEWMTERDLGIYLKQFDSIKPAGSVPWEKTHWITAAEGHWRNGAAEYRIRYADGPKDTPFIWYWFINMDQVTFSGKIQDYGKDGLKLVYSNSYRQPDGTRRYQGVWQKTGSGK